MSEPDLETTSFEHAAFEAADPATAARLKQFIERIERLEQEKTELAADIREIYAEAKGNGFDTKVMRQVIRLRKMEISDRREQEELLDLYMRTLEMKV